MTWSYYKVTTSLGRTLTIRGISISDVLYVFHNPCKRNQQTTLAKPGENVNDCERIVA